MVGKFNYERMEKPGVFESGMFSVMFMDIVGFTRYGDNTALRRAVRERAMSCGDVNHILCTDQFAKPCLDAWPGVALHDIGAYERKGRKLQLYNYHSSSFGNPKPPERKP